MNVTLSIDEETLTRAEELASQRGVSLEQLIQDYLEHLTAQTPADELVGRLEDLWNRGSGDSGGRTWTREELHERSGLH